MGNSGSKGITVHNRSLSDVYVKCDSTRTRIVEQDMSLSHAPGSQISVHTSGKVIHTAAGGYTKVCAGSNLMFQPDMSSGNIVYISAYYIDKPDEGSSNGTLICSCYPRRVTLGSGDVIINDALYLCILPLVEGKPHTNEAAKQGQQGTYVWNNSYRNVWVMCDADREAHLKTSLSANVNPGPSGRPAGFSGGFGSEIIHVAESVGYTKIPAGRGLLFEPDVQGTVYVSAYYHLYSYYGEKIDICKGYPREAHGNVKIDSSLSIQPAGLYEPSPPPSPPVRPRRTWADAWQTLCENDDVPI